MSPSLSRCLSPSLSLPESVSAAARSALNTHRSKVWGSKVRADTSNTWTDLKVWDRNTQTRHHKSNTFRATHVNTQLYSLELCNDPENPENPETLCSWTRQVTLPRYEAGRVGPSERMDGDRPWLPLKVTVTVTVTAVGSSVDVSMLNMLACCLADVAPQDEWISTERFSEWNQNFSSSFCFQLNLDQTSCFVSRCVSSRFLPSTVKQSWFKKQHIHLFSVQFHT